MKLCVLASSLIASACCVSIAQAAPIKIKCPTAIVDRQTGKYSNSKAKYACYSSKSAAAKAGYSKHSFSDDLSSCSVTPTATPNGGTGGGSGSADYSMAGPGERESVVFTATSGGTVTYSFLGGGEFEIKVLNANTGKKLEQIVETTQAGSGAVVLPAHSVPVSVKVEGPGNWTVLIDLN